MFRRFDSITNIVILSVVKNWSGSRKTFFSFGDVKVERFYKMI